jgi:hypothetical protein
LVVSPLAIDVSPTKTIVIGLICTNLAILGAPPCSHGTDGPFIDGLPLDSMVISHGYVTNSQMVYGKQKHWILKWRYLPYKENMEKHWIWYIC